MLRFLTILALLAATGSTRPPGIAAQANGQAAFVVHHQPAIPLVSLRMALLADDPPGYAGAGHLFQHLAYATLRDQAARVGADVKIERTADAIVYTVTGPAAELPYLSDILQGALHPRRPTEGELLTASRVLAEERLAEWETARKHIRSALRARLFPGDVSAAGTESSAVRLASADLAELWARLYRPDRISVVAVGDVDLPEIQQAFSSLPPAPARPRELELQDTVSLAPLAPAEATRGWYGAGYLVNDISPAVLSVTARLLEDALRNRLPGAEVSAEHWWTHHGQALTLIAAAPPPGLSAAQRALYTVASTVRSDLSEAKVREAAKSLRREMLFYSRTPDRMAEVLGRFVERGSAPDSAQAFYAALEQVSLSQVMEVVEHLLEHSPVRYEIPPQQLRTR